MKSGILGTLAVIFAAGWGAAEGPAPVNGPPSSPVNGRISPPTGGGTLPGGGGIHPYPGVNAPAGVNAPVLGNATIPGASAPGLSQAVHNHSDEGTYTAYGSIEYLLLKVRNGPVPLTATTVPVGLIAVDTSDLFTPSPAVPGVPGGTQTVGFAPVSIVSNSQFGARSSDFGEQCGFRLTAGFWTDAAQTCGVEGSFFALERGSDQFGAITAVSGNQFLIDTGFTRNLFLVQGGQQSTLATFPIFAVRETVSQTFVSASNTLFGGELNVRCIGLRFGCIDIGCLTGFRYVHFKDELSVSNQVRLFRPAGFPVTSGDASASLSSDLSFNTQDRIKVSNNFLGGQIGAEVDAKFGAFFINSRVKFGVGTILQDARVSSQTRLINNDPLALTPPGRLTSGGLLVGPNDVGDHEKNRFGFLSEVDIKLGYQVTESFRGFVGFEGLYLGHMARAGASSVINTLNTTVAVAGSSNQVQVAAPQFRFREQDIFVRGLTFGCEFRY